MIKISLYAEMKEKKHKALGLKSDLDFKVTPVRSKQVAIERKKNRSNLLNDVYDGKELEKRYKTLDNFFIDDLVYL